jgi:hypothetical protein
MHPDSDPTPPQIGRKRRRSFSIEIDDDITFTKKPRSIGNAIPDVDELRESPTREKTPSHRVSETEEVKEVTKGVKEVDLDDTSPQEDPTSSEESTSAATDAVSNVAPKDKGGQTTYDASEKTDIPKTRDDNHDRVESDPISPLELQSTLDMPSATSADSPDTHLPAGDNAIPDDPTPVKVLDHATTESTVVETHSDD